MGVLDFVRQVEHETGVWVKNVHLQGKLIMKRGDTLDIAKHNLAVLQIEKDGREILVPISVQFFSTRYTDRVTQSLEDAFGKYPVDEAS